MSLQDSAREKWAMARPLADFEEARMAAIEAKIADEMAGANLSLLDGINLSFKLFREMEQAEPIAHLQDAAMAAHMAKFPG